MARYTDAVCRQCRREGQKLFLKGDRCYTQTVSYTHLIRLGINSPARWRKAEANRGFARGRLLLRNLAAVHRKPR